jgi:hypothetical protein
VTNLRNRPGKQLYRRWSPASSALAALSWGLPLDHEAKHCAVDIFEFESKDRSATPSHASYLRITIDIMTGERQ